MRRKITAANWKMNRTHEEVEPYLHKFLTEVAEVSDVQIVFIPFYEGSVSLGNAQVLMYLNDIDGALVGGTSLDPGGFAQIVRSASKQ